MEGNTEGGSAVTAERLHSAAARLGAPAAIDRYRLERLSRRGYTTEELYISREVTPYNRLLIGRPPRRSPAVTTAVTPAMPSASDQASRPGRETPSASVGNMTGKRGKRDAPFKGQRQAWQAAVEIPWAPAPGTEQS